MKPTITFMPSAKSIQVLPGTTVLEAARRARVTIKTRCNGMASCLMCKVKSLNPEGLSDPGTKELNKLGHQLDTGVRLSCQAKITGQTTVEIPEDPLKAVIRAQLEKARRKPSGAMSSS